MGLASSPPYKDINSPQPSIEDMQKTASEELPKQMLGITSDTLRPFVEIGAQDLWKYSSQSGEPTLPPLGTARTTTSDEVKGEPWAALAEEITKSLPADVQEALSSQDSLDPHQKELFQALGEVIKLAAQTELFMSYALRSSKMESAENEALLNSRLPSIVTGNMVDEARKLAESLKEEMDRRMNNPAFDPINALLADVKDLIKVMDDE